MQQCLLRNNYVVTQIDHGYIIDIYIVLFIFPPNFLVTSSADLTNTNSTCTSSDTEIFEDRVDKTFAFCCSSSGIIVLSVYSLTATSLYTYNNTFLFIHCKK